MKAEQKKNIKTKTEINKIYKKKITEKINKTKSW